MSFGLASFDEMKSKTKRKRVNQCIGGKMKPVDRITNTKKEKKKL